MVIIWAVPWRVSRSRLVLVAVDEIERVEEFAFEYVDVERGDDYE